MLYVAHAIKYARTKEFSMINQELLSALTDLVSHIDELKGESSCIDEDIMQGEAYATARALISRSLVTSC